jgi:hypothetical protein
MKPLVQKPLMDKLASQTLFIHQISYEFGFQIQVGFDSV